MLRLFRLLACGNQFWMEPPRYSAMESDSDSGGEENAHEESPERELENIFDPQWEGDSDSDSEDGGEL